MTEEIKGILIKDFNEILVKEFCTDWKEKRLYIELLVNSTPFSNLLNYITNLQKEKDNYKQKNEKAVEKLGKYKHYTTPTEEQNSENEDIVDSAYNILQGGDE